MLTTWGRNRHIGAIYGSGDPAKLWLALLLGPADAFSTGSTISEPGGNYSRLELDNNGDLFFDPANGEVVNEPDLVFTTATSTWGTINNWALCTAATGGEILVWGSLQSRVISSGRTLRIPSGALSISIVSSSSTEEEEFDDPIVE